MTVGVLGQRFMTDRLDDLRAQWIEAGQIGDFDFAQFVAGITIVDQLIEREFKRYVTAHFGVQSGDVRILLALRRVGGDQGLRPTDLFKQLLVTSGAITKQIARLEARGYVSRRFNERGKRGWLIALTPAGYEVADQIQTSAAPTPMMYEAFSALEPAQRADMLGLLHKLVRNIQDRLAENPID